MLLLTSGPPGAVSGGHLYHRRLASAAHEHGVALSFGAERIRPLPRGWDVVVVDSIAAWRLAPAMARRRRRPPVVAMAHQIPGGVDGSVVGRRLRRWLDLFVYRRCDMVIAASATLRDTLVDEHGLDAATTRTVEPGCDLPPGEASTDLRQGRRMAALVIANWLPNKAITAVLEAVAGLEPQEVTLHLAGRDDVDPAYTAEVRERLLRPDLAGRVVVHGALDQRAVADLYAGADVLVVASTSEAYPTVVAEALVAGLPVVGWRRPFLERLVTDGLEGRLVTPGDIEALRATLRTVAADEPARRAMADAARVRGASLPTWRDTATAFFGALGQVTARSG